MTTEAELTALMAHAEAAAANAYSPYSHFRVGAAVLLDSGEIVTGCNVENASFRLTCCAEQTAIVAAVARFGPALRIRAIAVTNLNHAASKPCGACRQTILEFAEPDARIIYTGDNATAVIATFASLLPEPFLLSRR